MAYFADELRAVDFELFGSQRGDPAFQSEYELLAVLVGLRVFRQLIWRAKAMRVIQRSDNTATLHTALRYKASSPIMAQLAAEICLEVEFQGLVHVIPQHLAGVLNIIPDKLSRLHTKQFPPPLLRVERVAVPPRDRTFYRAWPEPN